MDFRHTLRTWRSNPALYAIAIAALALGIGANTTIFSVVQTVLIRPLPYRDAGHLVNVFAKQAKTGVKRYFVSPSDFYDWQDRSHALTSFAAVWRNEVNLTDTGHDPERLACASVTYSMLDTLGVQPILGHGITREEGQQSGPAVALIGSELWQRRYGSDPSIVGQTIGINGEATTVIGVLPPGIHFAGDAQVWNNGFREYHGRPTPRYLDVVARLRPGVSLTQAQAEMDSVARSLAAQFPNTNTDWGAGLSTVPDDWTGTSRPALLILLISVGVLLLIACANVANLLLAQASVRRREIAVRAALGASYGRLARQFLTESLALAIAGGGAGVAIAIAGIRAVRAFGPASVPRIHEVAIDLPVLFYTLGISIVSGLLFGIAPVWRSRRPDLASTLKEAGRDGAGGAHERRGRNLLVVAQVTLAVLLVNGAVLLIKSFSRMTNVNGGFRTEHVLTANIALPVGRYNKIADIAATFDHIRTAAAALPGVKAAGLTTSLPLAQDADYRLAFSFLSLAKPRNPEDQTAWHRMVSPGFFSAMGVALIAGRDFSDRDRADSPGVVVVNQALVRQYWPNGGNPIGQKVSAVSGGFGPLGRILVRDPEIVGVVADVQYSGLGRPAEPAIYFTNQQAPFASMTLVLRSDASIAPQAVTTALRRHVHDIDAELPLSHVRTMDEQLSDSVAQPRFEAILLAAFACLALLLGSVGIYGVLSYSVVSRKRELWIRAALGGRPADIMRLILVHGLALVGAGVVLGLGLSVVTGRLLEQVLFDVRPVDPATYAVVTALLAIVGVAAAYLPARAAAHFEA